MSLNRTYVRVHSVVEYTRLGIVSTTIVTFFLLVIYLKKKNYVQLTFYFVQEKIHIPYAGRQSFWDLHNVLYLRCTAPARANVK